MDSESFPFRPDRQRRECVRYALRLPVTFRWINENGKYHRAHGYTRDVGSRGLFVLSGESPPVNAQVDCNLVVGEKGGARRRLTASGRVVRVEVVQPLKQGFALMKDSLIWQELPERPQHAQRRNQAQR